MFGPEVALDELAAAARHRPGRAAGSATSPRVDPETGRPLVEPAPGGNACGRGPRRFGWHDRDPRPGTRREGEWLIGTGVASSVYPTMRMPQSAATIRFEGGRYIAEIGAADLGTGAWTVLPQIAAGALGVPVEDVDVRIGDTRYPIASSPAARPAPTPGDPPSWSPPTPSETSSAGAPPGDEVTGDVDQAPKNDSHASYAFGAQFAEARVNADTGEIRVPRLLGIFAAGRIINPRTPGPSSSAG